MGFVGYDCASSVLLCPEDNTSVLGFDEEDGDLGGGCEREDQIGGLDWFVGVPVQSDECLGLLVSQETSHLPKDDYFGRLHSGALDISVRREAIEWIGEVHAHYNFGPLSAYLSINYLDRFLSCYEIPQGKAWMSQLLSVACLSIAAKMEETEVPLSLDLQVGDAKYIFEAKTIQRMELLVLTTLKWRMKAVTPFSFADYFLNKFNDGKSPPRSLFVQSINLILNTIRRIDFLEFRPSEIAAAVALSVISTTQNVDANKAIFSCVHLSKERALRCYDMVRDMALIKRPFMSASGSATSVPQSPIGVLDGACLSYKSDDTTFASEPTTPYSLQEHKRRKLNKL